MAQGGPGRSKSSSHLDQQSTGEQPLPGSHAPHPQKGGPSLTLSLSTGASFNDHDGHKKSMLLKVKEKAKKWKQVLGKKRQGRQDGSHRLPSFGATSTESNRGGGGGGGGGEGGEEEEKAPSPGDASMNESDMAAGAQKAASPGKDSTTQPPAPIDDADKQAEMAKATEEDKQSAPEMNRPDSVKEITIQELPATANIAILSHKSRAADPTNDDAKNSKNKDDDDDDSNTSNTTTNHNNSNKNNDINSNSSSGNSNKNNSNSNNNKTNNNSSSSNNSSKKSLFGPAYTITQAIAAKIQGSSGPMYEIAAKQVWDKSLSMKEYLLQKLEPGEEDRALCQVITDVMTPRIIGYSSAKAEAVNTKNDSGKVTPAPISA